MKPAYLKTFESGKLEKTAQVAFKLLESCVICPRKCRINRLKDQKGFCKTGLKARIYSFMAHHGEEPPVSGENGSGTIFFAGCNMACIYCQNYEFSQESCPAREVDSRELASIMLELQNSRCHNINLVTPTHILPQILKALLIAIPEGLNIPLVYNTSGYELPEMIKMLDNIVDIYLPDMRYANKEAAIKYSSAPDYPEYNQGSLKEMQRQAGVAQIDESGIINKGLIIRHLVLPQDISGTKKTMEFIAQELSPETYISLMSQYMPCYKSDKFPELSRRISKEEYKQAKKIMADLGLHNGWIQESHGLDRFAGTNIKPTS
jgi:putative pyruvate formate lyase activating enzyme